MDGSDYYLYMLLLSSYPINVAFDTHLHCFLNMDKYKRVNEAL